MTPLQARILAAFWSSGRRAYLPRTEAEVTARIGLACPPRDAGIVVVRIEVPREHAEAVKRAAEAERDRLRDTDHAPQR